MLKAGYDQSEATALASLQRRALPDVTERGTREPRLGHSLVDSLCASEGRHQERLFGPRSVPQQKPGGPMLNSSVASP
eukprot:4809148-Alexandrium_andersonii.AAC.1